uniref:Tetraspanin-7-like n=1 Tax=Geotrypetes seraphini TaxID=260995 RepID=A0A6P8S5G9_GEOSA|nr:tetraspanin-7-like [Geotrypetes seraphini]
MSPSAIFITTVFLDIIVAEASTQPNLTNRHELKPAVGERKKLHRKWSKHSSAMVTDGVIVERSNYGGSGSRDGRDTFLWTYTETIYNYNEHVDRSNAVDNVQTNLKSCGVQSYMNWTLSVYQTKHGFPQSCCVNSSNCLPQDMHNIMVAATKVYQKGCYKLVTSFMETDMGTIAGVAFGIAFSQLIGMLLACCLSWFITANQYEIIDQ